MNNILNSIGSAFNGWKSNHKYGVYRPYFCISPWHCDAFIFWGAIAPSCDQVKEHKWKQNMAQIVYCQIINQTGHDWKMSQIISFLKCETNLNIVM